MSLDLIEESLLLSNSDSTFSFSFNNEQFELVFDNSVLKSNRQHFALCESLLPLLRNISIKHKSTQQLLPIIPQNPPQKLFRQFVSKVIESTGYYGSSNQYNSETIANYSDQHVIGKPKHYPNFGDSVNTWCTYDTTNDQFIIVEYQTILPLHSIGIYETYSHNMVTNVSAFRYETQDWEPLFCKPKTEKSDSMNWSCIFRPFVLSKEETFFTDKIKIEICEPNHLWYEVDAIEMISYIPEFYTKQLEQESICQKWHQWFVQKCHSAEFGGVKVTSKQGQEYCVPLHWLQVRCPKFIDCHPSLSPITLEIVLYYLFSDQLLLPSMENSIENTIDWNTVLTEVKELDLEPLYQMIKKYQTHITIPLSQVSLVLSYQFERTLQRDAMILFEQCWTKNSVSNSIAPDVTILFPNESVTITAHSSILMFHSEYFTALLQRWTTPQLSFSLELVDVSSTVFTKILKYMYLSVIEWDAEIVLSVYMAAKEFIMEELATKALEELKLKFIKGNEGMILPLAVEHDLTDLIQICLQSVSEQIKSLKEPIQFNFLQDDFDFCRLDGYFTILKTELKSKFQKIHEMLEQRNIPSHLIHLFDPFVAQLLCMNDKMQLKCKYATELLACSSEYSSINGNSNLNYSAKQLIGKPKQYRYLDSPYSWCPVQLTNSENYEYFIVKIKYPLKVCCVVLLQNLGTGGLCSIQGLDSREVEEIEMLKVFQTYHSKQVALFENLNTTVVHVPEQKSAYYSTWQQQEYFTFHDKACDTFLIQFSTKKAACWLEVNGIVFLGYKSSNGLEDLLEESE